MRLARSVLIDAPAPRVWALLDDERNISLWMALVTGMRYPDGSAGGKRVGSRFIQTLNQNGQISEYGGIVTEYEPGQKIALRLEPEAFTVDVRYFVTHAQDYDCVRLIYTSQTLPKTWAGRVIVLLGAKMLSGIADQQLASLKQAAENKETTVYGVAKSQTKT